MDEPETVSDADSVQLTDDEVASLDKLTDDRGVDAYEVWEHIRNHQEL